ncbi:redox-regulated ATPase YchF [candidate division WWE3 bacterium]|jgi:ribosome-binding ATPase|nr:redox-regulated ATPase YchF [candidate division WWE3 bacterium]MBT7350726.1 redox-regulated ATPase YchF [candidate division WWE3 bacterium]
MQIGIIGLPNVGKSTLFNALLKKQVALAANYPFATIEPNIGIVDVPDYRLDRLVEVVQSEYGVMNGTKPIPEKIIPAVVKFVDIAGLVKGASEGEGLGNKFLSHVREVDALVHVIRDFEDENIARAGSVDADSDREIIETELALADIQILDKRIESEQRNARSQDKQAIKKLAAYEKLMVALAKGELASTVSLSDDEKVLVRDLNLLTLKPMIHVYNVSESAAVTASEHPEDTNSVQLSAKLEAELSSLTDEEQEEYLKELGLHASGLDKVIRRGYDILGLQTFLTAGPKEVRAWTVKSGFFAPQAAGVIHTDFERGFISAEIIGFKDLAELGGWKKAKEKGKIRIEGKNYVMQDGDVVEFRFSV